MVYDGVFECFPRLRVATIEGASGWVGEWLERFDYRYKYMRHTSRMSVRRANTSRATSGSARIPRNGCCH